MATTVNHGKNFYILNVQVGESPTQILMPQSSGLAPSFGPQGGMVNSVIISCRSSVALQLTKNQNDTNYFTIPAGDSLSLDIAPTQDLAIPLFYLTCPTAQVTVEILFSYE